jgi:hypothetical protein
MQTNSKPIFGIPVTLGKLLSKTNNGLVVSFNLEHLLIQRLLRGQLYSENHQPLTLMVSPSSLPQLFQYPLLPTSPEFAIAQKEFTVFVFIKSPKFTFTPDLRVVFWFQRNLIESVNDNDLLDTPDQYMPLVIAKVKKTILLYQGKSVPDELEEEIKTRTRQMELDGNTQNYYMVDTFNLSSNDLEKLSIDIRATENLKEENEKSIKEKIFESVLHIISEITTMDENSRSIRTYLQEELHKIWDQYKSDETNLAFGYDRKAFAKKYFWDNGIKDIGRYIDFKSFYKNIFLK